MAAQFCTEAGCYEAAVGVGHWRGRPGADNPHPPRPLRCRPHYLQVCGPEFVSATVVGVGARITDARTGQSVAAGGAVELDPAAVNVAALVAAGMVRVAGAGGKAVKAGRA